MPWTEGPYQRFKRLQALMDQNDVDLAVISDRNSVYYFTGLQVARPILSEVFSLCLPTYLFVFKNDEPVLFIGERERAEAQGTFGGKVATYVNYDIKQRMIPYQEFVAGEIKKAISVGAHKARRVGAEYWNMSHTLFESLRDMIPDSEFLDLSPKLLRMRTLKDQDEIWSIRRSCELNDFGYSVAKDALAEGKSEIEVYSAVQHELTKRAESYQLFAGDFVSGERSLQMGGPPTPRLLKNGETFILDLWLTWRGYWSDTSRTFIIGNRPTAQQTRLHETLKEALSMGEKKLQPGVRGKEVYKAVFDFIDSAGYGDFFPHHAGHGLGLDDQEPPFFIPASDETLEERMVCTLEPGIYVRGVGGFRLENNYLIRADGPERLTNYPLDI